MEREFDLLFMVNLARSMGDRFNGSQAHRQLNMMRANVARQNVLAMGGSDAEAEEAAANSGISVQAVRRQLRLVTERAQEINRSGMLVMLDDQIAEIAEDVADSYRATESIWQDIERSRQVTQRTTRGRFRSSYDSDEFTAAGHEALGIIHDLGIGGTEEGRRLAELMEQTMSAQPPVQPEVMATVVKETAAAAALYSRLAAERSERRKLRQEARELKYGREIMQAARDAQRVIHPIETASDPQQARDLAVVALTDELQRLNASEQMGVGPFTPEMMRLHRAQTADVLQRVRAVKELNATATDGDGGEQSFTFRVVQLDPSGDEEQPINVTPAEE